MNYINRVPNDPRREKRGISKQIVTLWPLSQAESKPTLDLIELIKPQGVCLHGVGYEIARSQRTAINYRRRFGVEISCAIAGDYDNPNVPGFADGWKEAAQLAQAERFTFIQPNCEIAWLHRPQGSATTALHVLKENAPSVQLRHTTYGAIDSVDRDLSTAGVQGFGGHHGGELNEFTHAVDAQGNPLVEVDNPQWYWGTQGGELKPRGPGLIVQDAYIRSSAHTVGTGSNDETNPKIKIYPYLQAWGGRPDELAHCSEYFEETQWWALKSRSTAPGWITIACLSELYRRGLSIEQFQAKEGLQVDGWLGPKTYDALLPNAQWVHPQSKDGKSPKQNNAQEEVK